MGSDLERVRVFYDAVGRTLSVWIADPESEDVCEEADDGTILVKDSAGSIIGLEKLEVLPGREGSGLIVEVMTAPPYGA